MDHPYDEMCTKHYQMKVKVKMQCTQKKKKWQKKPEKSSEVRKSSILQVPQHERGFGKKANHEAS